MKYEHYLYFITIDIQILYLYNLLIARLFHGWSGAQGIRQSVYLQGPWHATDIPILSLSIISFFV